MIGLGSRKSLETILSSFNKILNDLKNLQEINKKVIAENKARIDIFVQHNNELTDESAKAARVEEKLTELVS